MYLDKDAILNSLTKEDVIKVVTSLGSEYPKTDHSGNLIFQSICHNAPNIANSWKLYYYHDPSGEYKGRTFHCYSKCSDSFSIVELVIRAKRAQGFAQTWFKALKYIGEITGRLTTINAEDVSKRRERIDDFEWINRLKAAKRVKRNVPTLTEINENILDIFYYAPHEDWLNDHISREALSRFEIGYYGLTNQITIPHRDKNGRLIGIRGRYLDETDVENIGKYAPLQINGGFLNHQLGSNLYGLHVAKEKIERCKKIMIVESEKSCLQAYSYFGEDTFVVAVCGCNLTRTQIKMINELQVEEVMIAFDREYEEADSYVAELYYRKLVKLAAPLVPYCKVYLILDNKNRLPFKASPTDCGKDILMDLMKEKWLLTVDEVNLVMKELKGN